MVRTPFTSSILTALIAEVPRRPSLPRGTPAHVVDAHRETVLASLQHDHTPGRTIGYGPTQAGVTALAAAFGAVLGADAPRAVRPYHTSRSAPPFTTK